MQIKLENCSFCQNNTLKEVRCASNFYVKPLEQLDILVLKQGKMGVFVIVVEKASNYMVPVRADKMTELSDQVVKLEIL